MLLKILSTITDKIKKTLFNLYTDPKEETVEEETIIQGRFHLYNYCSVCTQESSIRYYSK